mgnify:CR=1 FL=1
MKFAADTSAAGATASSRMVAVVLAENGTIVPEVDAIPPVRLLGGQSGRVERGDYVDDDTPDQLTWTATADSGLSVALEGSLLSVSGAGVFIGSSSVGLQVVDPDGNEALNYAPGSTLYARVTDSDQNGDDGSVETLTIAVTSETETSGEALVLTETGPASGVFAGSMGFEEAAAVDNDGTLQVTRGDRITAT